ncbi:MAG: PHP domain-containing protein [Deltaproteobacteria bacterium]|nr:PHP domain-containing protein [Deltaproteobacteria bacterium]
MIDLHTHSTESDGTCTPTELIELAVLKGIDTIALTDHDTCAGLKEAGTRAAEMGIKFIPGIELDIDFYPGEFHLLGLNIIDWENELEKTLQELHLKRKKRNLQMIDIINDYGIDLNYEELKEEAGGKIIARPHFASLFVKKKVVKNAVKAFDKFLAVDRPFYVKKEALSLEDGIRLIKKAGGHPVIAHPMTLYLSWGKMPERMRTWKEAGIEGIEVWHSGAKIKNCLRLEKIADELKLFKTGGSDFHGNNRADRPLGLGAGKKKIPLDKMIPFL